MTQLLTVNSLSAHYDNFQALFDIELHVDHGECVVLVGSNGAGKSTLLNSIAGLTKRRADSVLFEGRAVGTLSAPDIVRLGIALVPEGRRLYPSLTVEENLLMGAQARRAGPWTLARVYELFPNIAERKSHRSSALSGGQQQMVALGRALMSNPRLLLCDEISLGLAPIVVRELYHRLSLIRGEEMALIVVEQDISQALSVADRLYCLRSGRVALDGFADQLSRDQITDAYFGVGGPVHGSY